MKTWTLLISIKLVLVHLAGAIEYAPTVQLSAGKVRGIVRYVEKKRVYEYQGIRFGHAKRYEEATLVPAWSGVYDATKFREQCPQPTLMIQKLNGTDIQTNITSEDCLYLNIWTPAESQTGANLSVMAFIHGGTYLMGSIFSLALNGQYMSNTGQVVIVTIAYRLGGFAYATSENIPTNLGLRDQIFALKWIKENIRHFGGDANSVTIFGESSGAMNVGHLVISPLAKGLFKRAIIQSGSPLSPYGILSYNESMEKTKIFAKRMNCPIESASQITTCLREKSTAEFINATLQFAMAKEIPLLPIYGDDVMPYSPLEAIKSKKFNPVDVMFGVCNDEGAHFALMYAPELANPTVNVTLEWVKAKIKEVMKMYNQNYGQEIADFYTAPLHNVISQNELKTTLSRSLGDLILICPTILFGEHLARHGFNNNQSHFFSYRLMQHMHDPVLPIPYSDWLGILHGEDLNYLFFVPIQRKSEERQLGQTMMKGWTNFAKFGNPGLMHSTKWDQAFDNLTAHYHTKFMYLKANHFHMVSNYYTQNCNSFWEAKIVK